MSYLKYLVAGNHDGDDICIVNNSKIYLICPLLIYRG